MFLTFPVKKFLEGAYMEMLLAYSGIGSYHRSVLTFAGGRPGYQSYQTPIPSSPTPYHVLKSPYL
jgi:hypothetical protein